MQAVSTSIRACTNEYIDMNMLAARSGVMTVFIDIEYQRQRTNQNQAFGTEFFGRVSYWSNYNAWISDGQGPIKLQLYSTP